MSQLIQILHSPFWGAAIVTIILLNAGDYKWWLIGLFGLFAIFGKIYIKNNKGVRYEQFIDIKEYFKSLWSSFYIYYPNDEIRSFGWLGLESCTMGIRNDDSRSLYDPWSYDDNCLKRSSKTFNVCLVCSMEQCCSWGIMAYQAAIDSHEMGHFLGDIPALFILALLAGYSLRKEQVKE